MPIIFKSIYFLSYFFVIIKRRTRLKTCGNKNFHFINKKKKEKTLRKVFQSVSNKIIFYKILCFLFKILFSAQSKRRNYRRSFSLVLLCGLRYFLPRALFLCLRRKFLIGPSEPSRDKRGPLSRR